jgi:hypothetical protein
MFSPVHDSSMAPTWKRHSNTGQKILKPWCIKEYNENRGIVDQTAM